MEKFGIPNFRNVYALQPNFGMVKYVSLVNQARYMVDKTDVSVLLDTISMGKNVHQLHKDNVTISIIHSGMVLIAYAMKDITVKV